MAIDLASIDIRSLIVTCVSLFSLIYTVIGMRNAGVTVFLLQIPTPDQHDKAHVEIGRRKTEFPRRENITSGRHNLREVDHSRIYMGVFC